MHFTDSIDSFVTFKPVDRSDVTKEQTLRNPFDILVVGKHKELTFQAED